MEAAALELRRGRRHPQRGVLRRALADERLAERVRVGDDASFEVLYDRHHRQLLAFCRHMLGDRTEAEDVLQHVFVAAYRMLRDDDRELHVKAWLYAVARNRCLSVLRGRRDVIQALDDQLPSLEGLPAQVQRRADLRELVADLQKLPEEQRAALVLAELGALSHEDIAAVLGVKPEKVKALVFQAREHLMQRRDARQVPCREIQEQLATLRGGALRRGHLKRHVEDCPACAAFGAEVRRQRAAMAALLPVVPGATLKAGILGSAIGGGGTGAAVLAGGAGAGLLGGATAALEGFTAKVLLGAALLGGGGAGGYAAVEGFDRSDRSGRDGLPAQTADSGTADKTAKTQRAAVRRTAPAGAPASGAPAATAPATATKPATRRRSSARRPARSKAKRRRPAARRPVPVAPAPAAPPATPAAVVSAPGKKTKANPKYGTGKSTRRGDSGKSAPAPAPAAEAQAQPGKKPTMAPPAQQPPAAAPPPVEPQPAADGAQTSGTAHRRGEGAGNP